MYIITARRMTSGDLLKYRKGLFITAGYESLFPGSSRSRFTLTVPPAGILVDELTRRLETEVRLTFDAYPKDLAGRAATFQKLVASGVAVNEALAISGLLQDGQT